MSNAIINAETKKEKSPFTNIFIKLIEGMTQQEIADKVGVSRQNVGLWIRGKTVPDIYTLPKIADAFNVSTDYLLGRGKVKSDDEDVKIAYSITGLSEEAIKTLCALQKRIEDSKPENWTVYDIPIFAEMGHSSKAYDEAEVIEKKLKAETATEILTIISVILENESKYQLLRIISDMMLGKFKNPCAENCDIEFNEILLHKEGSERNYIFDLNDMIEKAYILRINDCLTAIKENCFNNIKKQKAGD